MKTFISSLTLALLLTACASGTASNSSNSRDMVWTKPSTTEEQTRMDWGACKMAADTGSGGFVFNGFSAIAQGVHHGNIEVHCMESKGYTLVRRSQVPAGDACYKK